MALCQALWRNSRFPIILTGYKDFPYDKSKTDQYTDSFNFYTPIVFLGKRVIKLPKAGILFILYCC